MTSIITEPRPCSNLLCREHQAQSYDYYRQTLGFVARHTWYTEAAKRIRLQQEIRNTAELARRILDERYFIFNPAHQLRTNGYLISNDRRTLSQKVRDDVLSAWTYFTIYRHQMDYPGFAADGLPIGSASQRRHARPWSSNVCVPPGCDGSTQGPGSCSTYAL